MTINKAPDRKERGTEADKGKKKWANGRVNASEQIAAPARERKNERGLIETSVEQL